MEIRYLEPLNRAWERMVGTLFRPFDPVKWLILGFAAWLAGLAGGGGYVGRLGFDADDRHWGFGGGGGGIDPWVVPVVAVVLVLGAVLLVALLWISSRAKLVFLDDLVRGRAEIVEPWKRLGSLADSLFLWRLAFYAVCLAAALVFALVLVGPSVLASHGHGWEGMSFAAITLTVLFGGAGALAAGLVALALEAFVVPIMYRFELKAVEAWSAFLPWLRAYPGQFVLYALLVLGLAVGFTVVYVILVVLTCCIVALPYVGTVLLLPVWVTYRLLSVEFLAQFHPDLNVFLPPVPQEEPAGVSGAGPAPEQGPGPGTAED